MKPGRPYSENGPIIKQYIYKGVLHLCYMDKIIRMRLDTYQRIRRNFKGYYKESLADYFERLAEWLESFEDEN